MTIFLLETRERHARERLGRPDTRHIPPELHSKLMVTTGAGMEITVQIILRIDREFLAFKGRMAGSQDQGRLFLLPFENIDYINFQYAVKDEEFHEIFDTLEMPAPPQIGLTLTPPVAEPLEPEPVEVPVAEPLPQASAEPTATAPVSPSQRTPLKSAILERFRSRNPSPGPEAPPAADG